MLLAALWNAVDHAFPNTRIIGCNFHFRQCLWRRVQAEGTKCQRLNSVKQLILKELQTISCQNTHIPALLNF